MKNNVNFVVIIPARIGSSRLKNKPLFPIKGKPLLLYIIENVLKLSPTIPIVVTSDSNEILSLAKSDRIITYYSPSDLPSGTIRCLYTYRELGISANWIINLQCDEPLLNEEILNGFMNFLSSIPYSYVATIASSLSSKDYLNVNAVKVIHSGNDIICFSRVMPTYPFPEASKHVGLYAFPNSLVEKISQLSPSLITSLESLEQNEWLRNGIKMKVWLTSAQLFSVDTIEDVAMLEKIMNKNF